MALFPPRKKPRLVDTVRAESRMDPLHKVVCCIKYNGSLEDFKSLLSDLEILKHFKARLTMDKVDKGCSPLVIAAQKSHPILEYIMKDFDVNIEQETTILYNDSSLLEEVYQVEGATALWTASSLEDIKLVELLVAKGADIEHTCSSATNASPLCIAVSQGYKEICELLIENKVDFEKPNKDGQTPLALAVANGEKDCVELLIRKGANVNHKANNGNTPLHHVCDLEIAQILVKAGAKNCLNNDGLTPAVFACCRGRDDIMTYLNSTFHFETKEIYDYCCLLAASKDSLHMKFWIGEAVRLRSSHPDLFSDLPLANDIYEGVQEPATHSDLLNIGQSATEMCFIFAIYYERIIGCAYFTTGHSISTCASKVLQQNRYDKCIEFYQRSLDFNRTPSSEFSFFEELLHIIWDFLTIIDNGFIPPVEKFFRWGLNGFDQTKELRIISGLFHIIAVWIKMAEGIKEKDKQEKEYELISIAVQDMISTVESHNFSILIACLQSILCEVEVVGDIFLSDIPLHKAIKLLLECGCSVHCEDEDGNFPLHLAVLTLGDTKALDCVRTLLEYGAHIDAVNFQNKTAKELWPHGDSFEDYEKPASLQCLASHAIVKYNIEYFKVLPERMIEFVSWHKC